MIDFVEKFFNIVSREYQLNITLKDKQIDAINSICNGKDTLVSLPTGYGKTVCMILPVLLLEKEYPEKSLCTIIVSPLVALMNDQAMFLQTHNITNGIVGQTLDESILTSAKILFASPEAINKRRTMLLRLLMEKVCFLVYDECHCVSKWGLTFRPDYLRVGQLQAWFSCPVMALSATVTRSVKSDIHRVLGLKEDCEIVSMLPDRPNMRMLMLMSTDKFKDELDWVLHGIKEKREQLAKFVIYAPTIDCCQQIYNWFMISLMHDAFKDYDPIPAKRMVEMFHRGTDQPSKDHILKMFKEQYSILRIVISTIAFGIGIDIPDIRYVILWGLPDSVLDTLQLFGRGGRDGETSYAVCYAYARSLLCRVCRKKICKCTSSDKVIAVKSAESDNCVRQVILQQFDLKTSLDELPVLKVRKTCSTKICNSICNCEACLCCSSCSKKCNCAMTLNNKYKFFI